MWAAGMKRILFGWLCLFIVGCAAPADSGTPQIPTPDVSKITPAIRAACESRVTDADLAVIIAFAEYDRNNGTTKADELAVNFENCDQSPDAAAPCRACIQAILDEVYGPG